MGTFSTLREAQDYFRNDSFASGNGMVLEEIRENGAKASLLLGPGHKNANGAVMGGVIFTLADFAFAAAANQVHCPTVALDVSISFLSSVKGTKLYADAYQVKDGRTIAFYDVVVTDDTGRKIAVYHGTGYKS